MTHPNGATPAHGNPPTAPPRWRTRLDALRCHGTLKPGHYCARCGAYRSES